jgi:hypothetical protein
MTLESAHDAYLGACDALLRGGAVAEVERFLAPALRGSFATGPGDPFAYGCADAVAGLAASAEQLAGAEQRAVDRRLGARGEDEGVVAYEKRIERDGELLASAWLVEVWQREDGAWRLVRELVEHGVSSA